ncbi:MAG: helix-hairpin-helix domain-containing protein, partial [Flavitalea sp.]
VESCVNHVGVDLNTASKHLLTYVSGLSATLARNIVEYRAKNGAFTSRSELKKVPLMGPKTFEQCAGFLRIRNGKNPLDNSAVHPEAYFVVETMAKDANASVEDLIKNAEIRKKVNKKAYITETIGELTINDILKELEKPGLDPRSVIEEFSFDEKIKSIEDVKQGMVVPGIVTNITNFGAFVDIGVKQDGLLHISQISNTYISDPNQVLKLQQKVMVTVTEIDVSRKRISLSMKDQQGSQQKSSAPGNRTGDRPKIQTGSKSAPKPVADNPFAAKLAELKKKFKD